MGSATPEQAGIPRGKENHPRLHLCHCAQLNDGKGNEGENEICTLSLEISFPLLL